MKVVERFRSEKAVEQCDDRNAMEIEINGTIEFRASDGEPEDATLNRDFNDCYNITNFMKAAYAAGKAGEEFTCTFEDSDDI